MESPPSIALHPRWQFLLTWLGTGALVLAICGALCRRDTHQIEQATLAREQLRVGLMSRLFSRDFSDIAADVRVLGNSGLLRDYLSGGRPETLKDYAYQMAVFSAQHPEYDKIRYLGANGWELVRINHGGVAVPADQLQDKSERPFFQDTLRLPPEQIYVSAFDLNVEQGRLEQPPKPTLRLAMPIFDDAGRNRGAVVINCLGSYPLDNLKQLSPLNQHRMRVLNAQGYWLHAADPAMEWGFQLPGRADFTLARSDPKLWAAVTSQVSGQVPFRGGWFTWQQVAPSATIPQAASAEPFLVVASELTRNEISAETAGRRQTYLLVGGIMFLVATGSVWFFHARQVERRRAQNTLRLANAAAQESARLKAQFLANMSHEIRTPMNGVIGMIGLLLDTPLAPAQRSLAETVRHNADALLTIINDILDFSKIEAGQLIFESMPFDMRDPLESCRSLLAEKARSKQLDLACRIAEGVPTRFVGDAGRVHQVLLNLMGNALKFTERGGVTVTVTQIAEELRHVRLHFAVRDTGIGISAEAQANLFQPFVRAGESAGRKFGGTGLGLAICRQLVHLMGGEIGVESAPGAGSTFWFTAEFLRQDDAPPTA